MKLLNIFCALAIGMIANAQTHTIVKPLKLTSVPAGTGLENILVRDHSGMIKQVDKRSIIVPPTLQGILTTSSTCEYGTALDNKTTFKENGLEFSDSFSSLELTNTSISFLNKEKNKHIAIIPSDNNTEGIFKLPSLQGTAIVLSVDNESATQGNLFIKTIDAVRYLCLGLGGEIIKIKIEK
ncbi:hypothetical protein ACIPCA_12765 [Flavobacterium covae]|uniref:hypothetical protein n=1 Tax=Flavobacterium covae TaxID=2906076 RepID=UPI000F505ED7|nr:hypothetical protein [Flavobacterium covae]